MKTPDQMKIFIMTYDMWEEHYRRQQGWLNRFFYWITGQVPSEHMYFVCDTCGACNPLQGNAIGNLLHTGEHVSYGIGCACGQRYLLTIAKVGNPGDPAVVLKEAKNV